MVSAVFVSPNITTQEPVETDSPLTITAEPTTTSQPTATIRKELPTRPTDYSTQA